jgi:hypothetical protein
MAVKDAKARRTNPLDTPAGLTSNAKRDISGALTILLADMFTLYLENEGFSLAHVGATLPRLSPPAGRACRSDLRNHRRHRRTRPEGGRHDATNIETSRVPACSRHGSTRPNGGSGSSSRPVAGPRLDRMEAFIQHTFPTDRFWRTSSARRVERKQDEAEPGGYLGNAGYCKGKTPRWRDLAALSPRRGP